MAEKLHRENELVVVALLFDLILAVFGEEHSFTQWRFDHSKIHFCTDEVVK